MGKLRKLQERYLKGELTKAQYMIVETKYANGYTWGRLKSGAGWIALDYAKKL